MLLLDADGLVYTYGYMAQSKDAGGEITLMPFNLLSKLLDDKIRGLCNKFSLNSKDPREFKLYLAGAGNYRLDIATLQPYKGNRKISDRPQYYNSIRSYLGDMYAVNTVWAVGEEVDDCIGIQSYAVPDCIICTTDKDLDMIEGVHYNWRKDLVYTVDEEQAYRFFMNQLVVGDDADNVPSIHRQLKLAGRENDAKRCVKDHYKKQTQAMLSRAQTYKEMLEVVKLIYRIHNIPESNLEEIGKLLWIRRKEHEFWTLSYEGN